MATSTRELARGIPNFTRTKTTLTGLQIETAPEAGTSRDTLLGKWPRAEAEPSPTDEAEQEITVDARSSYTPSPTVSTAADTPVSLPNVSLPSEEDKKATNLFLARLKAKDEASAMSLDPNPPTIPTTTL